MKTEMPLLMAVLLLPSVAAGVRATELPPNMQWSDVANNGRNMVLPARNLPENLEQAEILWRVERRTGFRYAQPIIKDDRVYIGAEASSAEDPDLDAMNMRKDGLVSCRDARSGELLWELAIPKHSLSRCGVVSPPVIDGDRVYMLGVQEILCLDVNGQADGNDGPFRDELAFMTDGAPENAHKPEELKPTYGDIIWVYDFKLKHGTHFEDAAAGTVIVNGPFVWATTSHRNGVKDKGGSGDIPNVIVLDRETGELVARDRANVPYVFHGQWSSLSSGKVDGRTLVFWGDGYGVLHAFEQPRAGAAGVQDLAEAWRYDCNPPHYRHYNGNLIQYSHDKRMTGKQDPPVDWAEGVDYKRISPSEVIAAPVFYDGRVYVHLGRDDHYDYRTGARQISAGMIHCVDPGGAGDITNSGRVWANEDVGRSQAQVSIQNGDIYLLDTHGHLFCLGADSGKIQWMESLGEEASCRSPLLADGKLYIGTDRRRFLIYQLGDDPRLDLVYEGKTEPDMATPGAIDGMLVIATPHSITAYTPAR
jgi:outer membrane protein assembly factor BamB